MERATYRQLPMTKMMPGTTVQPPGAYAPKPVRADAPAIEVMTDFRQVPAATIRRNATVREATHVMIARGVRLLIVVGADRSVEGLVTAHDTMGERAIMHLRDRGLKHGELTVNDLMTPRAAIDVLDIGAVLRAEVGHVIATLKESGRQHVLVVDRDPLTREEIVRGVFSITQIARQLGVPTLSFEVAQTFAEIEAELGR